MSETENTVGTLYLAATPIGNLEDMTYRAVRVLGEVDVIAAEDTRHTRGLLTHFDIHTPLVSYHEHNKDTAGPPLVERLLAGENIACVSDAGLPGIADPGADLARRAIAAGITVTVLPGANAALTGLIASGLDTVRFSFVGFLPRTKDKRRELLAEVKSHRETLIFYEAPHRLAESLKELTAGLGGSRPAVLCRELTKKYEEYRRGTLQELLDSLSDNEQRGEFVIIVGGCNTAAEAGADEQAADELNANNPEAVKAAVAVLTEQGMPEKEAMRQIARQTGLSRRDIYRMCIE
ncbi:MAG: 16S rRNA (cytidine(1402)-2'-O)-methyltransferase [Selenomonadaceae bacterium]|nr:16S rRNA (cytidine(1402)-2'-O)-methyltransferase [Selenomonadaceae bacterium]